MLPKVFRSLVPESIKNKLRKFVWMRLNPVWTLKSGITIRVLNYNDWMIYNDIFVDGEYDDAIGDLLQGVPESSRPARVLDLGGNTGFFTLRLADLFLRAGRDNFSVTVVEGSPSTYAELRERLGMNRDLLGNRVTAINSLAGNRSGVGQIAEGVSHGENTILNPAGDGKKVSFIDLDDLVRDWERIDLLKCDIEGAEELFLRNYPELLQKTDRAIFEFHHAQCDIPLCRKLLADAGLQKAALVREFGRYSVEFFRRES